MLGHRPARRAATTTSGGPPATTSGTRAPTAPTRVRRARPSDLARNLQRLDVVTLTWTAPGDDWLCGTATKYRIIGSNGPIHHPSDGTVVGDFTATAAAGQQQQQVLSDDGSSNFAVLYQDDAGNWGHLASDTVGYVRPKGATPVLFSLGPPSRPAFPNREHQTGLVHDSCNPAGAAVEPAHLRHPRRERPRGEWIGQWAL